MITDKEIETAQKHLEEFLGTKGTSYQQFESDVPVAALIVRQLATLDVICTEGPAQNQSPKTHHKIITTTMNDSTLMDPRLKTYGEWIEEYVKNKYASLIEESK